MDDIQEGSPQTSETRTFLPDVVHSQQIPATETAVTDDSDAPHIETSQTYASERPTVRDGENFSETESISEQIPSKLDYSISDSFDPSRSQEPQNLLNVESVGTQQEKVSGPSSLNIPLPHSPASTHNPSRLSTSWPLDVNAVSDIHHLSEESPVNLASSDYSKEDQEQSQVQTRSNKPESPKQAENENLTEQTTKQNPRSELYLDSLNEESSHNSNLSIEDEKSEKSNNSSGNVASSVETPVSLDQSSGSEEIIKLDIRGSGAPKIPLQTAKIIFGPPPEGSTVIGGNIDQIPVFPNLLSPFLVGAGDSMKLEEVFDFQSNLNKVPSPSRSPELLHSNEQSPDRVVDLSPEKTSLSSSDKEQDALVEEVTVDYDMKDKDDYRLDDVSIPTQPKSMAPEETMSFSTLTTDYKTICEEYHTKLVHLEDAISQRDELIEELTVSLQQSVQERDNLRTENTHLSNEVHNLQHIVAEHSQSDHDTVKGQLSDFMKYESLIKDESTKFYSALMSGGSSLQSSNGEKDNDREEITVNYSRSDLKSSESSDDFHGAIEAKVTTIISKFDEYIEENLRNKICESIMQVMFNEVGKLRIDSDTEIKELETQMNQDKQSYNIETRRLRELLDSVKAGNADIDSLRQELSVKHEKEMENLRTYFEKKCSDMERSYSEEVWRGRCASPGGSAAEWDAAGDGRRRTRSAEPPELNAESLPPEPSKAPPTARRLEQQLEEARADLLKAREQHAAAQAAMQEQIKQLKAHLQTAENTEANVSVYQQDIDLELEKDKDDDIERRMEQVRQEVVQQLQEQIQVLLSDPDAEVASWPLELVALRDKVQQTHALEKEVPGPREEAAAGAEADKWRQRRNLSFDQNRQLEQITKERDGLKVVAGALQHAVGALVAYCASAEDELNRTLLTALLGGAEESSIQIEEDSQPCSPNLSIELNTSAISRASKHVHFAPDLKSILEDLDSAGLAGYLQKQRDIGADVKRELEISLTRLRHEAQELLELSTRVAANRGEARMLEPAVRITELVEDVDARRQCDDCHKHRESLEEATADSLQRERLLRGDLDAAMARIAAFVATEHVDVVAEGYGTVPMLSLPARPVPRPRLSPDGTGSLESPRACRLSQDLEMLHKENEDLQQQLEAANRQLRSTRAFVDEQASEREAERDEFARRLADLRDENARLTTRLQNNARILNEVEQLETQTREMNQIISELESRKASTDEEIKSYEDKIILLRDIIGNLENQLEQKTTHEADILKQLQVMKDTIEERDDKMRSLLAELEALRSERVEESNVTCVKCDHEEDRYNELLQSVNEQTAYLSRALSQRTRLLERAHEHCSAPCSEPSEDVSLREQKHPANESVSPPVSPSSPPLPHLAPAADALSALARAEDAALKRIADLDMQRTQLKDVAQEVRAERDALQSRMSEQALRISALSARLQRHRTDADALAHQAASDLSVQLHDATAEVQRLKDELESKDKQLSRVKQTLEEREKQSEQHQSLYGNSCNPKDKVIILERELTSSQGRIGQLETLIRALEADKDALRTTVADLKRTLAEKEDQLQEIMALKLEDEQREEKSEIVEGKVSARTLSDIVSISEFDEQDLQMRKAELKGHNIDLSGAPYEINEKANRTLPPEISKANMSSLNLEYGDHFDLTSYTPRADSLPAHLTSTQNKDLFKLANFRRNVNETTIFGTIDKFGDNVKHSTAQNIPDNCSMYPNREVSDTMNNSVEPKKINFSLEPTPDNRMQEEEEFTSLREMGITLDIKQENYPDILTQLKHEIKKSRVELETCRSELKTAEEQLCEFPALKEEVEELKGLLENTMATMENDKKFYENQLDNFSSNKKLLEQRLTELSHEVNEKSKDLHLLKEDILRRENMILELAKEKRSLSNKMSELELKIEDLQSRNTLLEQYESENVQMREKMLEMQKLEQLVSEKNQQIDSLNQHLDRLDDLQRTLNNKTEELENLKEAFEEKSNEIFQLQDSVESLTRDMKQVVEENNVLNGHNKELKLQLSKLEKEQENASLKLQSSESERERLSSLNNELASKIDELKLLNEKLKDKETEIEILNEDINSYHEEIATLKEQLQMASRSPSPRKDEKTCGREERAGRANSDKKQLAKIRKQISFMQYELDTCKKDLNDKAFELAKAKLDNTELLNAASLSAKQAAEQGAKAESLERQLADLQGEREQLAARLGDVDDRIREESNLDELKAKLRERERRCEHLENELRDLRDLVDRMRSPGEPEGTLALVASGTRSPTAELERALRDQLNYSHTLDEDIMEQILSASSDDREEIPRLALHSSQSCSSVQSPVSDRVGRLRAENDRLREQVAALECRVRDKDALIAELNRVRDTLSAEAAAAALRWRAERDNAARLHLLLDTHKDTAHSLQSQDTNMIQMLKKRLESAMRSELDLQQSDQQSRARIAALERQLLASGEDTKLQAEMEASERLRGEVSLLKSKLEVERARAADANASLERVRAAADRERALASDAAHGLRTEMAELKRQCHESAVEALRLREVSTAQARALKQLDGKRHAADTHHALSEIESHKTELSRELASLKKCISEVTTANPELVTLRAEKQELLARLQTLEDSRAPATPTPAADEREQALRFLHARCLRLESCRKALVWQKRYLQRVLAGYQQFEKELRPRSEPKPPRGKARFRCIVSVVIITLRMEFLVRRRRAARALSAAAVLRAHAAHATHAAYTPHAGHAAYAAHAVNTPQRGGNVDSPMSAYATPVLGGVPRGRPRRAFDPDLRNLPASPHLEFVRRSPFNATTSPREEPFILSSPRGETAAAYLSKLELVSRCLSQAVDSRDAP